MILIEKSVSIITFRVIVFEVNESRDAECALRLNGPSTSASFNTHISVLAKQDGCHLLEVVENTSSLENSCISLRCDETVSVSPSMMCDFKVDEFQPRVLNGGSFWISRRTDPNLAGTCEISSNDVVTEGRGYESVYFDIVAVFTFIYLVIVSIKWGRKGVVGGEIHPNNISQRTSSNTLEKHQSICKEEAVHRDIYLFEDVDETELVSAGELADLPLPCDTLLDNLDHPGKCFLLFTAPRYLT